MGTPIISKGFSERRQLGILLAVWGACFIAGSIFTVVILMLSGIKNIQDPGAITNPANSNAFKAMQIVSTFFIFFLPPVIYAFICYKNGWLALGLQKRVKSSLIFFSALIMLVTLPVSEMLASLNKAIPLPGGWRKTFDVMEASYESQITAMVNLDSASGIAVSVLMVAILPAIFEELLFRGGLQNIIKRWSGNPWLAIILTSLIFSAIHGSWYGFIPRTVLGILLGFIFYTTGNLWYSIFMHFVNNFTALLFLYIYHLKGVAIKDMPDTFFPWWVGVAAMLVLVGLLVRFYKNNPPQAEVIVNDSRLNPFGESKVGKMPGDLL